MIPPNLDLLPARIAAEVFYEPVTTIKALCERAGTPYKYAGGDLPYVGFARGTGNLRAVDAANHRVYVVDRDQFSAANTQEDALRVLEVLAHSFHDYAARECVRGLFGYRPGPVSSAPIGTVTTAAQRKAKQRERARQHALCMVCLIVPARKQRTTCARCARRHLDAQRARRANSSG